MRFIELLCRHDRSKTALITESGTYTYGDIINAASAVTEPESGLWVIRSETVYGELVSFLAAKNSVPIIIQNGEVGRCDIPPNADFAVSSSGSTGTPKLMFRTAQSWYKFFDEQNRVFSINSSSTLFMHGSLCFSGNLNIILGALYAGAAVIISKGRLTRERMYDIEKYGADIVYLIPDKLNMLCKYYKGRRTVKSVIAGSQSMGTDEAVKLQKALGTERVILYYGASEVSYISYLDILSENRERSCIGRPFNGIEISCDNGFLEVMSDYTVIGAAKPYRMADIITRDSDGYIYFNGRRDDVLNIGGEKLSASALENEIKATGGIDDACVFLQHGENGREILCCAYVGKHEAGNIRLFYMPKRWYKVSEIPKNANGKTDREKTAQWL